MSRLFFLNQGNCPSSLALLLMVFLWATVPAKAVEPVSAASLTLVDRPSRASVQGAILGEISDRGQSNRGSAPQNRVHYKYRNDGQRTITAYRFECLVATNSGRSAWIGKEEDRFAALAMPQRPAAQERGEDLFVQPGETIETSVGVQVDRDGPFAVQTCGMVAVIYDDGDGFGAPEKLDKLFAARREIISSLQEDSKLLADLQERLDRSGPLPRAESERALSNLLSNGMYAHQLGVLRREFATTGSLTRSKLNALAQAMKHDIAKMKLHVRPQDLTILEEGPS